MTKNAQRLSQLISTFGPGAMIDLPTRSVVVGGLEQWDMKGKALQKSIRNSMPYTACIEDILLASAIFERGGYGISSLHRQTRNDRMKIWVKLLEASICEVASLFTQITNLFLIK